MTYINKNLPAVVQESLAALTPLQRRFVQAYCGEARGNGTLAAKLSGIGGSYNTQASRASQLKKLPAVRAAIEAWMNSFALTGTELTAQLEDMAQVNPGPFVKLDATGTLTIRDLEEDVWLAHKHWIKGIEFDAKTGKVTRLILHDSLAAKRELAKILKLYTEQPVFNFNVYLAQLSDNELMQEYEQAKQALAGGSAAVLSTN